MLIGREIVEKTRRRVSAGTCPPHRDPRFDPLGPASRVLTNL